jgi:hypothetical protein
MPQFAFYFINLVTFIWADQLASARCVNGPPASPPPPPTPAGVGDPLGGGERLYKVNLCILCKV